MLTVMHHIPPSSTFIHPYNFLHVYTCHPRSFTLVNFHPVSLTFNHVHVWCHTLMYLYMALPTTTFILLHIYTFICLLHHLHSSSRYNPIYLNAPSCLIYRLFMKSIVEAQFWNNWRSNCDAYIFMSSSIVYKLRPIEAWLDGYFTVS